MCIILANTYNFQLLGGLRGFSTLFFNNLVAFRQLTGKVVLILKYIPGLVGRKKKIVLCVFPDGGAGQDHDPLIS